MARTKTSVKIADEWLRQVLAFLYRKRNLTRGEIGAGTGLNAASASHALRYLVSRGILLKRAETQRSGPRRKEEAACFADYLFTWRWRQRH